MIQSYCSHLRRSATAGLLAALSAALSKPADAGVLDVFNSESSLGSGYYSNWLGTWWTDGSDWLWHVDHGWLYVSPGSTDGNLWVWEQNLAYWWWTSDGWFPILVAQNNQSFWYSIGTKAPRVYWSYSLSRYVEDLNFRVPAYEPNYWNSQFSVRWNNNCYNYACNKRTDTFAQPGLASGQMYTQLSVASVKAAALRDGLEVGTAYGPIPRGKTRVDLVVAPGIDYHWYRQDENGRWSHKPGRTHARDWDNSQFEIYDVSVADWGIYSQFGGYFFVDSNDLQGLGLENIQ